MPSTMTNSAICHNASATPPVWVSPVRQPATMLRGYLNSSIQRVFSTGGRLVGSSIEAGSTISAQASDLRASSSRPLRKSHSGDSGTNARM